MIKVKRKNGRFLMVTPYSNEFVEKIKNIGSARWNAELRAWSVKEEDAEQAKEVLRDVFGEDGETPEKKYRVKIRIKSMISELNEPVFFMGKTLAAARGRDTGARVGDDVVLVDGEVTSGGSARYWKTIVYEESVFILKHVGESRIKDTAEEIEVLSVTEEHDIDVEALNAEKEKLMARIAEIDKLLAAQQEEHEKEH